MANAVTVLRIGLLFVTVALLFAGQVAATLAAMALSAVVIALDGVDGWVARRFERPTTFGAMFDIAGDRIVEVVLLFAYAQLGLVGLWAPIIVLTRGVIVDGLRGLALEKGMTPFGPKTMMRSRLGYFLTASRFSRAAYGVVKTAAFLTLAGDLAARQAGQPFPVLAATAQLAVVLTVALCVIRGVAVLLESRGRLGEG